MSTVSDTSISIDDLTELLRSTPQGALDGADIDRLEHAVRKLGRDDDCWIAADDARVLLGVTSDQIIPAMIQHGQIRGHTSPGGACIVRLVDVLRERWVRESLLAPGGDELSPEELKRMKDDRPGTNPRER